MKTFNHSLTNNQLKTMLAGKLIIREELVYNNVSELNEANEESICFFENPKYEYLLESTNAGLIFVPETFDINRIPTQNLYLCTSPYIEYVGLIEMWLSITQGKKEGYLSPTARIAKSAKISPSAWIGEFVVINENVQIGSGTIIESHSVIQTDTQIGNDCFIHPHVTIYENTIVKNRVIIHSGAVIGADGFGYHYMEGQQHKIPQVGNVLIEDDVEIGANTTIDRATLGTTLIGTGTKIDNLVQVGHNCKIGSHTILCAQVGLAGNTELGNVVYLGGQVGVAGHLRIDDGSLVGAQSGIISDLPSGRYFGTPAVNAGLQMRIIACSKQLPEMVKYINQLKKRDE